MTTSPGTGEGANGASQTVANWTVTTIEGARASVTETGATWTAMTRTNTTPSLAADAPERIKPTRLVTAGVPWCPVGYPSSPRGCLRS